MTIQNRFFKHFSKKSQPVSGLVPFIGILGLNISIYRQICQLQKGRLVSNVRFSIQNQQEIRLCQISVAITAGLYHILLRVCLKQLLSGIGEYRRIYPSWEYLPPVPLTGVQSTNAKRNPAGRENGPNS